jgi:hypothetical protein
MPLNKYLIQWGKFTDIVEVKGSATIYPNVLTFTTNFLSDSLEEDMNRVLQ